MTRVTLTRGGGAYRVEARGHAATVPLCAAVSCLMYTLAGWLRNTPGAEEVELRLDSGDARLVWRGGAGSDTAFELTEIGFLLLRETAPDSLSVAVCEEDG